MTGVRSKTPHDKVCTAISILQAHILAADSALIPEKIWGHQYMRALGLEQAVKLLIEVLDDVPDDERVTSD